MLLTRSSWSRLMAGDRAFNIYTFTYLILPNGRFSIYSRTAQSTRSSSNRFSWPEVLINRERTCRPVRCGLHYPNKNNSLRTVLYGTFRAVLN